VAGTAPELAACRLTPTAAEVRFEWTPSAEGRDVDKDRGGIAGISLGGIIVIVGIVLMFVWSLWIGLIIVLVGLIAFGGFARGKWY
jgi:hypothetical protein